MSKKTGAIHCCSLVASFLVIPHRLTPKIRCALDRLHTKQAINQNTAVEIAADRSKRLLEEQKTLATALAVKAAEPPPRPEQPPAGTPDQPAKSVGQRSLELWKMKNATVGK